MDRIDSPAVSELGFHKSLKIGALKSYMSAPYTETSHVTTLFGDSCAKQLSVLELPFDQQSDIIGHVVLKTS